MSHQQNIVRLKIVYNALEEMAGELYLLVEQPFPCTQIV